MANPDDIDALIFEFQRLSDGAEEPAWVLGGALNSFDLLSEKVALTESQCEKLLSITIRAQVRLELDLPPSFCREALRDGMRALGFRIVDRADPPHVRASRAASFLADDRDYVRILRNEAHNFDLRKRIAERRAATDAGPTLEQRREAA